MSNGHEAERYKEQDEPNISEKQDALGPGHVGLMYYKKNQIHPYCISFVTRYHFAGFMGSIKSQKYAL